MIEMPPEYCSWCGDELADDVDLKEFHDDYPFCSWNCSVAWEAEHDEEDE